MRQEQQSLLPAQRAADFKINFQMTDGGARWACSVTIQAANKLDADIIFRQNWSSIEQLARLNLATKTRSEIRLDNLDNNVMPPPPSKTLTSCWMASAERGAKPRAR